MGSEITPFGANLLRSEAAASSRIENLTASAKAVALAGLGDTSRRNATEIVANTTAMTAAIALADRLDASAILAMHAALLEHHDPKIAGTWRSAAGLDRLKQLRAPHRKLHPASPHTGRAGDRRPRLLHAP